MIQEWALAEAAEPYLATHPEPNEADFDDVADWAVAWTGWRDRVDTYAYLVARTERSARFTDRDRNKETIRKIVDGELPRHTWDDMDNPIYDGTDLFLVVEFFRTRS